MVISFSGFIVQVGSMKLDRLEGGGGEGGDG